jgi:hypothetical protein
MIRLSGTPRSQRINPLPIGLLLSDVAHCPSLLDVTRKRSMSINLQARERW